MKKVTGANHLTLAVRDLDKSVAFYCEALGLILRKKWDGGAYLEAGKFWFCLLSDSHTRDAPHPDYTHFAFSVDENNFEGVCQQLHDYGVGIWKENQSEGLSFYFLDPDYHKMELHVGTLETRLAVM